MFGLLGGLFVVLAVMGAILPVLPTTPFLLAASYCYVRSFPRCNEWLLNSPLFGPLLRDWQRCCGVRLHVKLTAMSVMLVTVSCSILSGALSIPWLIVLCIGSAVGLVVVWRLPTVWDAPAKPTLRVAGNPDDLADDLAA